MFAAAAHLTLTAITDPRAHGAHNAWRRLDMHAELLVQPGIVAGEGWVRSPDCIAATTVASANDVSFHYADLYWLRGPVLQSARELVDAFERAFQRGQRPDLQWSQQHLAEFFVPLKGYVNPRALVSADALPLRPSKGAYLVLSRFRSHDAVAESIFRWYDQVRIPDLLQCSGAAGAWTFAARDLFKPDRDLAAPALRLVVVYLDGDPLTFAGDLATREPQWRAAGRVVNTSAVEQVLFAGPLRTIVPWRWDWFDEPPGGARP